MRGPCACAACAEREQLGGVASFNPDFRARVVAMSILGAMEAVAGGSIGGVSVEQLFD